MGAACGAGASALGAASAFLHLFLSEFQLHALSAVHDASSVWAAHPLFGLLQPTSDKVRAIITNAYLMLVFLQGICGWGTSHHMMIVGEGADGSISRDNPPTATTTKND